MYAALVARAHAAGMAAGEAARPTPMVVGEAAGLFGTEFKPGATLYHVPDGVCGFAWVHFAGNTAFGRWARKAGVARPDYPTGLCVWVSHFGQSMERKEAYARAYCAVLREAGVDAYVGSRMD